MPVFEWRLLRKCDWLLLAACLLLGLYGLVAIYSASMSNDSLTGGDPWSFVRRQAIWLGIGLAALGLMVYLPYEALARLAAPLYVLNLAALGAVLVFGSAGGGAARWIGVGTFRLQPSEFAKIIVIITLAAMLSARRRELPRTRTVALSFACVAAPTALVFVQPDLGTALALVAIWFVALFLAGASKWHLLAIAAATAVIALAAWQTPVLKPYQKARLTVFLDPSADPLGDGYHINQSKIAVGSGQWLGKGLLHGTQSQLHFIPAQHTDFIFTVVGEELGFAGAAALLGLYGVLLWRGIDAAARARDALGRVLAGGVVAMLGFQIFVNIGMTVGIMPITGLPLPFLSYGGSNLVAVMMGVGLLLNVSMRRQKILL